MRRNTPFFHVGSPEHSMRFLLHISITVNQNTQLWLLHYGRSDTYSKNRVRGKSEDGTRLRGIRPFRGEPLRRPTSPPKSSNMILLKSFGTGRQITARRTGKITNPFSD
ncbi:hypothetical protein RvY_09140 [Ramazzottius varieornatus]|uniref:Uncharacterized protein n=1 Tax=Ramazzottius varieornatus TaxID=947166 RepID=A0A1D1VAK4_RAMVA|nr:hypothetical protein RvY_09140 [Ramazzottius varieornatus]